jgi:hypothetical protein
MDIFLGKDDPLPFPAYKAGKGPLGLSYSKISTWLTCRQRFYYEYEMGLAPKRKSMALQVGGLLHQLMKEYYTGQLDLEEFNDLQKVVQKFHKANSEGESMEVALTAAQLMLGYIRKYQGEQVEVTDVEQTFFMPRTEPETKMFYIIHGTIDAMIRFEETKRWQFEHKTTARNDSLYLRGLRDILQGRIYHMLSNYYYDNEVVGIIFNILVKTKVPQFDRAPVMLSQDSIDKALETIDGVVREIVVYDIFRNFQNCTLYNRECDYKLLCDKPEQFEQISNAFYEKRDSNPVSTAVGF